MALALRKLLGNFHAALVLQQILSARLVCWGRAAGARRAAQLEDVSAGGFLYGLGPSSQSLLF